MKNLHDLKSFQSKKRTSALKGGDDKVFETVNKIGDNYAVETSILIPISLVNGYIKKVKDESGQNLRERLSDQRVAEELVRFLSTNYVNIENFPTAIVLGDDFSKGAQIQPQGQPVQPQAQMQPQPEAQVETPQGQAQATAQEIPAQEGGGQGQAIQGQATQGGQGQAPQGGQTQAPPQV